MSESQPPPSPTPADSTDPPPPETDTSHARRKLTPALRRGGIRGMFRQLRASARDAASNALNKLFELPPEADKPDDTHDPAAETRDKADWRVKMLHNATERLRGAADGYIAAKLDEIEARVDAKLDSLEDRLDQKVVELHRQLREMRDRELRHRLRLLKITLVFTVLVAALSLVYKWLAKYLTG